MLLYLTIIRKKVSSRGLKISTIRPFSEDRTRPTTDSAKHILASGHNLTIRLLKRAGYPHTARVRRYVVISKAVSRRLSRPFVFSKKPCAARNKLLSCHAERAIISTPLSEEWFCVEPSGTRCSMPVYTYRCEACGLVFDQRLNFHDPHPTHCPECGEEALRRVYKPVGIVFKGSGFYATDHRSPSGGNGHKATSSSTSSTAEAGDSNTSKTETTVKGEGKASTSKKD